MIPIQDIDVHTSEKVLFKLHLIAPSGSAPFLVEVLVYDSEFDSSCALQVPFDQQFQLSSDAFSHAFNWVKSYSAERGYSINFVNNPCNCEFLSQAEQQDLVAAAGLSLLVKVNGV